MSRDYAEDRIREALEKTGGNEALARQQVVAWAQEDSRLLQALVRPHMSGIVAYRVERVASGRADAEKLKPPVPAPDNPKETFGKDILRAVIDTRADVFGHEHNFTAGARKGVSSAHLDAIRQIATKKETDS